MWRSRKLLKRAKEGVGGSGGGSGFAGNAYGMGQHCRRVVVVVDDDDDDDDDDDEDDDKLSAKEPILFSVKLASKGSKRKI